MIKKIQTGPNRDILCKITVIFKSVSHEGKRKTVGD